jgi:hypothetical protein
VDEISLYSSPEFDTPKKEQRVSEVLYSDTAHSLGDETDTGVANVTIDMDDEVSEPGKGIGHESDHTGIEMGGGGGIDVFFCKCGGGGDRENAPAPWFGISESSSAVSGMKEGSFMMVMLAGGGNRS